MEGVKYSRGARTGIIGGGRGGGERGRGGRVGGGLYVEIPMGGRRGGREGGFYRGGRYGRGGKPFSGSVYRGQSEQHLAKRVQNSAETDGPDGRLKERDGAVIFNDKETMDCGMPSGGGLHVPPENHDEKDVVVSSRVPSTEASEYNKSQRSSQNPSPAGGFQDKYNTDSSFYDDSRYPAGRKPGKNDRFHNSYKGRRVFGRPPNEGILELRVGGFEVIDPKGIGSEEVIRIGGDEAADLSGSGDNLEVQASTERPSDPEKILTTENQIHIGEPSSVDSLGKDRNDQCSSSNHTDEHHALSSKPSSQLVGEMINWMIERQEEAIQWLKGNGKYYPPEESTEASSAKPPRFPQNLGYRNRKHAWSGNREGGQAKARGYKEDETSSPYCPSNAPVCSAAPDRSDRSTLENPELPQPPETSDQAGTNAPDSHVEHKQSFHPKQRFENNGKFNREKVGASFPLQAKTKEGEACRPAEARNGLKYVESSSKTGNFNSPRRYRGQRYKRQPAQKEL